MSDNHAIPDLIRERAEDAPLVEVLIARAFGPGRYAKTAERLREGNRPILDLSFVAWIDGKAVGCVRLWPVRIGETAALLLGPFAVDATHRGQGLGAALINRAYEAAEEAGRALIVLVGDEAYFAPMGFKVARDVAMPGPVDPRRVLVRTLRAGASENIAGEIRRLDVGTAAA